MAATNGRAMRAKGSQFDQLVASIREHGLEQDLVKDRDGKLLDGRNRLKACMLVGVTPRFTTYNGEDCVDFVVRHNVTRRHLDKATLAFIAAEMVPMYAEEAKARQVESGRLRGKSAGPKVSPPRGEAFVGAGKARDRAGAAVVAKRRNKPVAQSYVVMSLGTFARLLADDEVN
jgi:hypothetical protein